MTKIVVVGGGSISAVAAAALIEAGLAIEVAETVSPRNQPTRVSEVVQAWRPDRGGPKEWYQRFAGRNGKAARY